MRKIDCFYFLNLLLDLANKKTDSTPNKNSTTVAFTNVSEGMPSTTIEKILPTAKAK